MVHKKRLSGGVPQTPKPPVDVVSAAEHEKNKEIAVAAFSQDFARIVEAFGDYQTYWLDNRKM